MRDAITELAELTDQQLVKLALGGDRKAFGELTQRHWRKYVDLGCFFLHNRSDAEDQVQNAILKAYEHLDQYHGDAEFSTWMSRIVVNQCLMLMRHRRLLRLVYLDEAPTERGAVPIQLAALDPDPEGELAFLQLTQVLELEVGRIPRLMRNVMLLRDVQGLPLRDVANQLGITISAVKSRLVRARAEVRGRMSRHSSTLRSSSALSRAAAPLSLVGRHSTAQMPAQ